MTTEVEYPLPKKCIVCRNNFFVGCKIRKTTNELNNFYTLDEKFIIQFILNILLPKDIVFYIIDFLKTEKLMNFGHKDCCQKNNKNILWLINSKRDMHMIRK